MMIYFKWLKLRLTHIYYVIDTVMWARRHGVNVQMSEIIDLLKCSVTYKRFKGFYKTLPTCP